MPDSTLAPVLSPRSAFEVFQALQSVGSNLVIGANDAVFEAPDLVERRAQPDCVAVSMQQLMRNLPSASRSASWSSSIEVILSQAGSPTSLTIAGVLLVPTDLGRISGGFPSLTTLHLSNNGIGAMGAAVIARGLPNLTSLNLNGNWIGDEGAVAIAEHLPNLTHLTLCNNSVGVEGATAIARRHPYLTTLDLSGNGASDEGAVAIAEHLPKLMNLNLSGNRVGVEGVFAIAGSLHKLTNLDLSDSDVTNEGASAIAEQLPSLTSLNLGRNLFHSRSHQSIGDEGAVAISKHLPNLTELELSHNNIGREGVFAIAGSLPNLTTLGLWGNNVGVEGASAIARQLSNLAEINLSDGNIGAEGAIAIAEHIPNVTNLWLWNNGIGDAAAMAMAEHLSKVTVLNLGKNNITAAGATAIAEHLQGLATLELWNNNVADKGAAGIAEHLSNLSALNLGKNNISDDGAIAIAKLLPNLTTLDLWSNTIGVRGAAAIAELLPNLTALDLRRNNIGDEGAAAIAEHLLNLCTLDLGDNGIDVEGATAIAEGLPSLTALDLSDNIIDDGMVEVLNALAAADGSRIVELGLHGNPGIGGLSLPELASSQDARAILAAYRDLRGAAETGGRPFGEAKLVVLGDGAVGKTSLLNALINHQPCNPTEAKTPGVEHRVWTPNWTIPSGPSQVQLRLNVWDFGGQVILQQTHKYFLTDRCIPIVVHDNRDEDDRVVRSWLKVIRARAPNSPVIVVVNKCDRDNHNADFGRILEDYPEIVAVFPVSCRQQPDLAPAVDGPHQSLGPLRECITGLLRTDPRLESVQQPVPSSWVRVRDEIRDRAQSNEVMDVQEYVTICASADHVEDRIVESDRQRGLLRMLEQMGVLVAHGLTDRTRSFTGLTLLNPNWLTTAIYALLADKQLRDRDGVFDRNVLRNVLMRREDVISASYPADRLDYIVDMMQKPEFTLAFRLDGMADPPQYLLTEALPSATPAAVLGWQNDSLRFRYRYPELREGLMPQFLVVAHEHFGPKPSRWRYGCTLEINGCPILVTASPELDTIDIQVAGAGGRRDALAVIRSLFDRVHMRIPEAQPSERVPIPNEPDVDVDFQHLLQVVAEDGADEMFRPEGAMKKYRAGDLLDGVHQVPTIERRESQEGGTTINLNNNVQSPGASVGKGNSSEWAGGEVPPITDIGAKRKAPTLADTLQVTMGALTAIGLVVAAIYLWGKGDGWPTSVLLGFPALGAALGAVLGFLIRGVRKVLEP